MSPSGPVICCKAREIERRGGPAEAEWHARRGWFTDCLESGKEHIMVRMPDIFRQLSRDERGAVSTEYLVLVGTMGLALVFALVAVGPGLVKDFQTTRTVIAAPVP